MNPTRAQEPPTIRSDESVAVGGYAPDGSDRRAAGRRFRLATQRASAPSTARSDRSRNTTSDRRRPSSAALRRGAAAVGDYRSRLPEPMRPVVQRRAAAVTWCAGVAPPASRLHRPNSVGVLDAAADGQDSAASIDRSARSTRKRWEYFRVGRFPGPGAGGFGAVFRKCRDSTVDSAIGRRLRGHLLL